VARFWAVLALVVVWALIGFFAGKAVDGTRTIVRNHTHTRTLGVTVDQTVLVTSTTDITTGVTTPLTTTLIRTTTTLSP